MQRNQPVDLVPLYTSKEMNNDNNLKITSHSRTKLSDWLRHCVQVFHLDLYGSTRVRD